MITTLAGINPNPRTLDEVIRNFQRLVKFISESFALDDQTGGIKLNVGGGGGLAFLAAQLEACAFPFTAGENISGHLVARLNGGLAYKADFTTAQPGDVFGVTLNAAIGGDTVYVRPLGTVDGFVGLTPNAAYFLGADGAVTLTPTSSGLLLPVGKALSATTLLVMPGTGILR